jgi:hypothetical protein
VAELTATDQKMERVQAETWGLIAKQGWGNVIEVLRDLAIAQAATTVGRDRETMYHVSKLFDGMMGLTKSLADDLRNGDGLEALSTSVFDGRPTSAA